MEFDKIYNDFIFWLRGLIEDDPIPYEINSLVFFIDKNFEIGFSGSEENNINLIDYYFYFPLEAEYFFSTELYSYIFSNNDRETQSLTLLKKLLSKLKTDNYFKNFNYYYGRLFKSAKKLEI